MASPGRFERPTCGLGNRLTSALLKTSEQACSQACKNARHSTLDTRTRYLEPFWCRVRRAALRCAPVETLWEAGSEAFDRKNFAYSVAKLAARDIFLRMDVATRTTAPLDVLRTMPGVIACREYDGDDFEAALDALRREVNRVLALWAANARPILMRPATPRRRVWRVARARASVGDAASTADFHFALLRECLHQPALTAGWLRFGSR